MINYIINIQNKKSRPLVIFQNLCILGFLIFLGSILAVCFVFTVFTSLIYIFEGPPPPPRSTPSSVSMCIAAQPVDIKMYDIVVFVLVMFKILLEILLRKSTPKRLPLRLEEDIFWFVCVCNWPIDKSPQKPETNPSPDAVTVDEIYVPDEKGERIYKRELDGSIQYKGQIDMDLSLKMMTVHFGLDAIFNHPEGPRIFAKILLKDGRISSSALELIQNYDANAMNILNLMNIREALFQIPDHDELINDAYGKLPKDFF